MLVVGGGVAARCHPRFVMSVDDIVNAFREKNQMAWTGPKRSRESYFGGGSDTEAEDEDQQREFLVRQENERAVIRRAQDAHYTLSSAIQGSRVEKDNLRSYLQAYRCETATNSHDALFAMTEHVYTSSASSNGQWALLLKHFAFTRFYGQLIDSGLTTAPLYVADGHETEAEEWRLRYNNRIERALSGLMDGAKTGLMKLGFLRCRALNGQGRHLAARHSATHSQASLALAKRPTECCSIEICHQIQSRFSCVTHHCTRRCDLIPFHTAYHNDTLVARFTSRQLHLFSPPCDVIG